MNNNGLFFTIYTVLTEKYRRFTNKPNYGNWEETVFLHNLWRNLMRLLGKLLLIFLIIWALTVSGLSFFGLTIIFPWGISETNEIPQHRAEVVRISIFLTFGHYGVIHLLNKTRKHLPIHFLSCYLLYLSITAIIVCLLRDVPVAEYFVTMFFVICYLCISVLTKQKVRDYLSKQ